MVISYHMYILLLENVIVNNKKCVDITEVLFYDVYHGWTREIIVPIRASKGFDRGLAAGEAIRCDTLIAKLKINAEDNLAYAA